MPRGEHQKKPYPPEFRAEAVRLYRSSGKGLREVSEDLGVSVESLRAWSKRIDVDAGRRQDGLTPERTGCSARSGRS